MGAVYMNPHSYPYQKDRTHYEPHYYPGPEGVPTQMYVSRARPPASYGCWPWASNYGYASPVVCHGCCAHSYWPSHYAWGSPYSHVPQPHCPGSCLPPHPIQHMPPPNYSVEEPRYEYENNVPKEHHCCGCPNHSLHQKERKNVRIEEEEPDRERRGNSYQFVPQFNNKHYPIVWLPPDYSNSKEAGGNESEDLKRSSSLEKPQKIGEGQPTFWNGWYPVDLNDLVSSKQTGDGERGDEHKGRFPFPIVWVPQNSEQKGKEEEHRVNETIPKPRLELENGLAGDANLNVEGGQTSCGAKDIPLKEMGKHGSKENSGGQTSSRVKDIPVKEIGQLEDMKNSKDHDRERDAAVKNSNDNGEKKVDSEEKKVTEDGSRRKSASPTKSSKLPPVCLRVDPLPNKKGANGSSRSPSTHGDKQKRGHPSNEASKVLNSSDSKELDKIVQNELKEGKGMGIIKSVEVVDGKPQQSDSVDAKMQNAVNLAVRSEEAQKAHTEENPREDDISQECIKPDDAVTRDKSDYAGSTECRSEKSFGAKEERANDAKKSGEVKLSVEEAAVILQSAYRGFAIRRWEPLKKLKEIAKVREQAAQLQHLIQSMELSSDIQSKSKQRNIIGETITSLLLKLDAIQELHPSIREIRKYVVRELVSLQEKLDALMKERSEPAPREESFMRHDQDAPNKTQDVSSFQNGNETPSDSVTGLRNQLDGNSTHEKVEPSEANLMGEGASEKLANEAVESCMTQELASEAVAGNDEKASEANLKGEESSEKLAREDVESCMTRVLASEAITENDEETWEANFTVDVVPDESKVQGPEKVMDREAFDVAGACNGKDATDSTSHEVSGLVDKSSASEDTLGTSPGQEVHNQTLQEDNSEREVSPANENTVAEDKSGDDAADSVKCCTHQIQSVVPDSNDHGGVLNKAEAQVTEACQGGDEGSVEMLHSSRSGDAFDAKDEMAESNRKLIEENERLREMMEKLIKSGQEQLSAISSLSGRVKDLEKRLSRKRKLKVKQQQRNKASSRPAVTP